MVLIESKLNEVIIHKMRAISLEQLKENKKIHLGIEIKAGGTISLVAFLKDQGFTLKYAGQFQKIALARDLVRFQNVMAINDLVMKAEIRSFFNKNRI